MSNNLFTQTPIAKGLTSAYKKSEDTATSLWEKQENFFVNNFTKVSDKATETLFGREAETLADTKARLKK